eukprot:scpid97155/ scgid14196/ 
MDAEKLINSSEDGANASTSDGEDLRHRLGNGMPGSERDSLLQDNTNPGSLKECDSQSDGGNGEGFSRAKGLSAFTASGMIMVSIVLPISMPYALAQASLPAGVLAIVLGATVMLYMAM